jgi:hypothetical protein
MFKLLSFVFLFFCEFDRSLPFSESESSWLIDDDCPCSLLYCGYGCVKGRLACFFLSSLRWLIGSCLYGS